MESSIKHFSVIQNCPYSLDFDLATSKTVILLSTYNKTEHEVKAFVIKNQPCYNITP